MTLRLAPVAMLLAFLATGCGEQMILIKRGVPSMPAPFVFWPPPSPTSIWASDPSDLPADLSFGDAAERITSTLDRAGYHQARWYPVGIHYVHGFALSTRLEGVEDDASPRPEPARWSPLFRQATDLWWLAGSREVHLPGRGRYRAFLVAFTDLPVGHTNRAPRWSDQTVLDGAGVTYAGFPAARRASADYRLGVYVYEYEADAASGEGGKMLRRDTRLPAAVQVERAGLVTSGMSAGASTAR